MGSQVFAGKVAIVTGATGGIGRGVALRLAAFVAGDVLPRPDMEALAAQAFGGIDVVANAGGRDGQTASASWEGGLIMSTKVIAKELAQDGIRVNCVCVTLVRETPGWDAMRRPGAMSKAHMRQYEKIKQRAAFGLACPDDIGAVVAFLASDDAGFVTGAVLS